MLILRKACEASRTGDFTNEKTGLELSFYKISQVEPESFGSECSVPCALAPLYSSTVLLCGWCPFSTQWYCGWESYNWHSTNSQGG